MGFFVWLFEKKSATQYDGSMGTNEHFVIKGLGGKRKLSGAISVRGAKNAALKALAATVLFRDDVTITNVPDIEDVSRVACMMEALGAEVKKRGSTYRIYVPSKFDTALSRKDAKRLRASIVLTGPILSRFGKVSFPYPGGCLIGTRPIDFFLEGFVKMGAHVTRRGEYYTLKTLRGGLCGAEIFFRNQSVTGTETFIMAGIRARGKTLIKNAALEPEIKILADYLNTCGAKIYGAGTPTIVVKGTPLLRAKNKIFRTPPDRIETGSFLILGALVAHDLTITKCNPMHLEALVETLKMSGVKITQGRNFLRIHPRASTHTLRAVDIKTHEYPGFPTDLQSPMTVFLTQTHGRATVFETIFEGRFGYVDELLHMGADINMCDPQLCEAKHRFTGVFS